MSHVNVSYHSITHICTATCGTIAREYIWNIYIFMLSHIYMCCPPHTFPAKDCCSALQCVAVCCSVLQCVAVCGSVLHPEEAPKIAQSLPQKSPLFVGLFCKKDPTTNTNPTASFCCLLLQGRRPDEFPLKCRNPTTGWRRPIGCLI